MWSNKTAQFTAIPSHNATSQTEVPCPNFHSLLEQGGILIYLLELMMQIEVVYIYIKYFTIKYINIFI